MKRPFPAETKERFNGQLRHYHRTGYKTQRTWDEWVDGKSVASRSKHWWKILLVVGAVLALGGIIVGLVIELR
ncbi:MAG: hypothetical protein WCJ14_13400 [Verrucomicrobiota bacterium]